MSKPDPRKLDLARIHMLKAELQWDESLYRDVMATVCDGTTSAAELDAAGRRKLIAHMEDKKAAVTGKPARKTVRRQLSPVEKKLWSLWMQAVDAGRIQTRTMAALNAWCKRQTGVDRIEWLTGKQADLCIESLKKLVDRG